MAPPKADRSGSASQDVLTITNNERGKAGCPALTLDDRLTKAATDHSVDMARNNYFSHTSQDGRTFVERAKAAGYPNPGAENIAKGQSTPEAVMDAWMKSAGHRENILNCGLKTMGLGLATDGYYWTQLFGR
ncbi:MAG: CAP domain-containing protein [Actinomycetota bacterium]|nr:CAP domain-containing protein [Actinomycetota bacterium]